MIIEIDDSRRLTGKNLLFNGAGAIIDAVIEDADPQQVIDTWFRHLTAMLNQLGWGNETLYSRRFDGGVSLALTAPWDALYAATEINEAAFELMKTELGGGDAKITVDLLSELQKAIDVERNPDLVRLMNAAEFESVTCISDDDEVSLGTGSGSTTWKIDEIPDPQTLDWDEFYDIPVVMVTGTNGKSTTVRLLGSIYKNAGWKVGLTSTDFMRVDGEIIGRGDYSGPGAARTILRRTDVDIAILEVARGGLLRRGLAIDSADSVVVTNVSADHLGEYGINTVEELAEVKFIVTKAIDEPNQVVLNADDPLVVETARSLDKPITWFSLNPLNSALSGKVITLRGETIVEVDGTETTEIINVHDVPLTFDGTARHNIQNVMAAVAVCRNLGLDIDAIRSGLRAFQSDADDNPGRGNRYDINGATIIVDFAHNENGLKAIVDMVEQIPAKRRLVLIGHAGDRSDEDFQKNADQAARLKPDAVILCEFPVHLRGRELGEIPRLFKTAFQTHGLSNDVFQSADDAMDGLHKTLDWAQPGDVCLLLMLTDQEAVLSELERRR